MNDSAIAQTKEGTRPQAARSAAVIFILLALVAGACFATRAFATSSGSLTAHITDADGNAYSLPLDEDATLPIVSSAGRNTVRVENGAVRVEEADCPGQDCVHQGEASAAGQQIVCLPHKLIVSVTANNASTERASSPTSGDATTSEADGTQSYDIVGS